MDTFPSQVPHVNGHKENAVVVADLGNFIKLAGGRTKLKRHEGYPSLAKLSR